MKILYLILFTGQIVLGQIKSEYLDFYPLKTGNYWEYEQVVLTYD
jgi:hypothetical protein